jgi:hypothetical protein
MTISDKQHPVEILAEWAAPAVLAGAAAWAAWTISHLPLAGIGAALVAMAAGLAAMRVFGEPQREGIEARFEPVSFEECVEEDVLLLDDPLGGIEPDARVARLFARDEATPGELVTRIADYLGDERRILAQAAGEGQQTPPDASAALHAALANIRASLR